MSQPTTTLQARLNIDRRLADAGAIDHTFFGQDVDMLSDEIQTAYQAADVTGRKVVTLLGAEVNVYIPIETARLAIFGRRS